MKLKALSVRPPWAQYIVWGDKRVENRYWRTRHRGLIAIHKSTTLDENAPKLGGKFLEDPMRFKGCIIGIADLIDCITPQEALRRYPDQKRWINTHPETWCWIFEEAWGIPFPFKVRGKPWLFGVDMPEDQLPESVKSVQSVVKI